MTLRSISVWIFGGAVAAFVLPSPREGLARRATPTKLSGRVGPGKVNRWPKPLTTRDYLLVHLRYDRGKLVQRSVARKRFGKRRRIKRIAGRFLAKLYRGKRLVDVVPFNFPLLAPAENFTRTGHRIARRMEANLRTAIRLKLPWQRSITRIEINDIGTARRWKLNLRSLRPRPRPTAHSRPRPGTTP
jgi:hypothetical protein